MRAIGIISLLVALATLLVQVLALFKGPGTVLPLPEPAGDEDVVASQRALLALLVGAVVLVVAAATYLFAQKRFDPDCGVDAYLRQRNVGHAAVYLSVGALVCGLYAGYRFWIEAKGRVSRGLLLAAIIVIFAAINLIAVTQLPVLTQDKPNGCEYLRGV